MAQNFLIWWKILIVVLEKTLEISLDSKEIKPVNPKESQPWIFIGRTGAESWISNSLATWCKELTHWKRPWCWERLRAGGEGWDGWMASLTQQTWVWVDSGSWWWTEKPGVLRFMGSQRVRHDWATELSWHHISATLNSGSCSPAPRPSPCALRKRSCSPTVFPPGPGLSPHHLLCHLLGMLPPLCVSEGLQRHPRNVVFT